MLRQIMKLKQLLKNERLQLAMSFFIPLLLGFLYLVFMENRAWVGSELWYIL